MSLFFVGQFDTAAVTGNIVALLSGLFFGLYFIFLRHNRSLGNRNPALSVFYGNVLIVILMIPLVAPNTPPETLREIGSAARGFVYVVSVTGVTGERTDLPPELRAVVEQVRESAPLPAAVGFGIGTPEQAAAVGEIADGVIIGSRLVREIGDSPSFEQGLAGVDRFLRETADALQSE
jgi:hypothetical protein